MSQPSLVEPENPLDLNWATDVATKLGFLALKTGSDLSVSRVTVNVTTFLRLHRYWEEDRAHAPFLPKQAALAHYGLLRGVAGGLIEDLEKLVDEVLYWQRRSRKTRGDETLQEKVRRTFDTPRVKTILASLQYLEATISLIIEVWRYGAQRADAHTPTEEDYQRLGRTRRLIRSLIMNRGVALKYVSQRLEEENATLLNDTGTTADGRDSDKSLKPTILLSRRSIHAEQLSYLDEVLDFGDDSRESVQRQDQLVHNLVERWSRSQFPETEYSDHESVFDQESDEEAATGGYGGLNTSFSKSQTLPTRDQDPGTSHRAHASFEVPRVSGRQPSLVLDPRIPTQQPTPPAAVYTRQSGMNPVPASASFSASPGPPYSVATPKPQHTRAFSMSQAEPKSDSQQRQKTKTSRDSGYITENVTGTIIDDSDDEDIKIYWQIAIGKRIYPYENGRLVDSSDSSQEEVNQYISSHDNAVTEIPTSTVVEAALQRQKKYIFGRIPARGRFCEMWRIQTALKYNVSRPDVSKKK